MLGNAGQTPMKCSAGINLKVKKISQIQINKTVHSVIRLTLEAIFQAPSFPLAVFQAISGLFRHASDDL